MWPDKLPVELIERKFPTEVGRMKNGYRIRPFTWELYPQAIELANSVHLPAISNRNFVDHYYLGQEWSKLFLVLDNSRCIAMMGVDLLRFIVDRSTLKLSFGNNFYSLQPGIGGVLWTKSVKLGDLGMVFGGSEDTHRIARGCKFDYYPGINIYQMNARFESYKEDSIIKGIVKSGLRPLARRKLTDYASREFLTRFADVQVAERREFFEELPEGPSPFTVRFHPSIEYLRWRYNPHLPHVRYRLFDILRLGQRRGICVLNDGPNDLMMAYADGDDAEVLAAGILKAIFQVGEGDSRARKVTLSSSHPAMQAIFCKCGFRMTRKDHPFAAGSLRGSRNLGDPATWLINIGMGDNDLRQHMFWPAPVPAEAGSVNRESPMETAQRER